MTLKHLHLVVFWLF